ncbi:hypothetical protein TNCV_4813721 [Trichonephila clavipes]|nr:hypothetical protein TNCV_4813721 [Trichonephila clavipes]
MARSEPNCYRYRMRNKTISWNAIANCCWTKCEYSSSMSDKMDAGSSENMSKMYRCIADRTGKSNKTANGGKFVLLNRGQVKRIKSVLAPLSPKLTCIHHEDLSCDKFNVNQPFISGSMIPTHNSTEITSSTSSCS